MNDKQLTPEETAVAFLVNRTLEDIILSPHRGKPYVYVSDAMTEYASQQTAALQARVAELENALHRDETGLAKSLSEIRKLVQGYSWIREGRGPHAYNDDKYFEQAGYMLDQIDESAKKALAESGKRSHAYCCGKSLTYEQQQSRIAELERENATLKDQITFAHDISNVSQQRAEKLELELAKWPITVNELHQTFSENVTRLNQHAEKLMGMLEELHSMVHILKTKEKRKELFELYKKENNV